MQATGHPHLLHLPLCCPEAGSQGWARVRTLTPDVCTMLPGYQETGRDCGARACAALPRDPDHLGAQGPQSPGVPGQQRQSPPPGSLLEIKREDKGKDIRTVTVTGTVRAPHIFPTCLKWEKKMQASPDTAPVPSHLTGHGSPASTTPPVPKAKMSMSQPSTQGLSQQGGDQAL